jgi:hypothetical protein
MCKIYVTLLSEINMQTETQSPLCILVVHFVKMTHKNQRF